MAAVRSFLSRRLSSQAPPFRPRRVLMYVPGSDQRKLEKARSLNADSLVFDCEDGVAFAKKEEARAGIVKALETMRFGHSERVVRINSVESGLAEEDLNKVLSGTCLPDALMLPKVESPDDVFWFQSRVQSRLSADVVSFPFMALIESARALINLREICEAGIQGVVHLSALTFGADDYAANIGAKRTKTSKEVLCARQLVVMYAKAYNLQAIDIVDIDFNDLDGLKREASEGATMGFTGKQAIHPNQIPIVQAAFSPNQKDMKSAQNLIEAFNEHQAQGKGAFTYEGKMIDMPTLLQAKNITTLAEAIGEL